MTINNKIEKWQKEIKTGRGLISHEKRKLMEEFIQDLKDLKKHQRESMKKQQSDIFT